MAESVGLSAKGPDLQSNLSMLNSLLDVTKKTATLQPEIAATVAEAETKKVKSRGELAQLRDNVFNAIGTSPDVLALEKDPTNDQLQAKVKRLITDQADQAVERLGKEYRPQIYGAMGKMMDFVENRPQDFAQNIRSRVTAGAGNLVQQELQTPRIQVNAAGQLVRTNPVTNQVEILGDARQFLGQNAGQPSTQVPNQPQGQPQIAPPMSANPTTAAGQVLGQTAKTGTEDWNTTFTEAQAVPVRVQALEKIRDLSKKTTTGTGAEQVRLLDGVLDLLGIDRSSAANLDELKKNSAILQMGPAGTDLARSIQSMATPGAQIQPEAIRKISDQLIGLERRKSARAKFLEPFKNNADLYQSKAMEFNQVANPIFFQDISNEEYNKYKRELPEDRRNALKQQAKKMRELGIE